ncbi:MAG TPA: efflux RND transporter periplasmic adaptor subunit [Candidatus Acidoferrales bacterium]|nr:efflux RND transporter periplasmic adaptor subunit [Candidatus Acidoferrales bacterium]
MAKSANKKRWGVLALVAGLGVVVMIILASRGQAPVVTVATVEHQDLNAVVTSNGKVEPISPAIARAQFPGFVGQALATEGQSVRHGEVILRLDAADIRSQLAQAEDELLAAKTDLRNARAGGPPDQVAELEGQLQEAKVEVANLERNHKALVGLVAKQAATQDELAQNEANLTKARAKLQSAEERRQALAEKANVSGQSAVLRVSQQEDVIRSLKDKLKSATVTAAMDGTLYSLPVRAGDYVQTGQVLAEMADLNHVRVRAFVDEPDLGWLEPGQSVDVTWDAKPGQVWTGQTTQIPKQVVPRESRSVGEVLCSVDNSRRELLPNVNVEVRISVRERKDALVVPRAAVAYDKKGQRYVYVYNDGKVHRRNITVGIASASNYEVLSGLTLDERVALPANVRLKNGMDVRVAEAR